MRVIIVEDENLVREDLKNIISSYSEEIDVVNEFSNGVEVINFIKDNDVDIMFLDINIPILDGMSLAKMVSKFEKKPYIIFITAHKEFAVDAFDIQAYDYILKPYTEERIVSVLENILGKTEDKDKKSEIKNNSSKKITIKENNSIKIIDDNEVYYLKSDDKITYVSTLDKKYKISNCIADVEKDLDKNKFFRCHRSYIVNIDKITSIENHGSSSHKLKLKDIDDEVYVSRRKLKELKEVINIKTL